ncbi:hypothetical protein FB45DRAFT_284661 [Roridomyces roridus]|uniref:Uncharacterized protein n=1 Tax=Roridomyces roridus TaxID=1738132 RepID=A0AAD7FUF9_9AGAR|nr:hypothetical protein FB45DRAFT_284661 [Roridomyces roridus]
MAAEHSPLYKTIAEQVTAYIDIAVREPAPGWGPTWTGEDDESPMEVLYDYDVEFPLPAAGLATILAIPKTSDDHRIAFQQVMGDLLNIPDGVAVQHHIILLRLAYRSRFHKFSLVAWYVRRPTHFVINYLLLARAEGAMEYHNRINASRMAVGEFELFPGLDSPNTSNEKPLPLYIGAQVHARLVDVKARLNAIGFGHDLGLVQAA